MAFAPKPEEPKKGAPEYMNTYGDLVTLMLTFFVLLYSMSSLDVAKFKALADSFGPPTLLSGGNDGVLNQGVGLMPNNASPTETEAQSPNKESEDFSGDADDAEAIARANKAGRELSDMASEFKTYFAENTAINDVTVTAGSDYLRLTFPGNMLFASGEAYLSEEARNSIDLVAARLAEHPDYSITVEGHTDDIPMSNTSIYPTNRHLSSARADTVVEYLIDEHGFNPKTTSSLGMGEYWELVPNDSAENRAINRRVEIIMEKIENVDGQTSTPESDFFGE